MLRRAYLPRAARFFTDTADHNLVRFAIGAQLDQPTLRYNS